MFYNVIIEPNSVLHKPCEEIKVVNNEVLEIAEGMIATLKSYKNGGVGLAAPQVGVLKRLILVRLPRTIGGYTEPIVFINPKITSFSNDMVIAEEGCLSIPDTFLKIARHKNVTVEYLDDKGNHHEEKLSDYAARIVQHEVDHINGILITDRYQQQKLQFDSQGLELM